MDRGQKSCTRMNKDREPQSEPRTIEQVAQIARENMLRDGYHVPMVLAEGSRQEVVMQIAEIGKTFAERERQMVQAGFALAQTGVVGILHQVFYVGEGWMSVGERGQEPHYPPSQDPTRKEVLLIMSFNAQTGQSDGRVWEMVRDATGKLVDVVAFEELEKGTGAESPLLVAFVAGFALGSQ